jgi:hypothetical protein
VSGSDDLQNWKPLSFRVQGAASDAPRSFYQTTQLQRVRVVVGGDAGGAAPKFYKLLVK